MKRLLKKAFHKFVVNEKGAVSIYLIIVAVFLLLFNAVLIDFARIIIAERQTEEAAKVALRSSLAAYNTDLQNKGLFGLSYNQEEAESVFKEVFKKNLEGGDNYNLLGLKPVGNEISLNLNMERSLANKDILKYQILEEMKYKAPVEIGEALLKDFLSIAEHVQQASDYAKVAKKINKKAKNREELLEDVEQLLEDAKELLEEIEDDIHGESGAGNKYPNVKYIDDIFRFHGQYLSDLEDVEDYEKEQENKDEEDEEEDDEEAEGEIKKKKKNMEKFKNESTRLLKRLIHRSTGAKEILEEALELIEEAEDINEEIESDIEEQKKKGSSKDYEDAKEVSLELEQNDSDLMGTLDNYVINPQFFTDLKAEVNKALNEHLRKTDENTGKLIPKLEEFLEGVESDFSGKHRSYDRHVEHIQDYHEDTLEAVNNALDIVQNSEYRKDYKENEDEIKEEEDKADEHKDETKELLDDLDEEMERIKKDRDIFDKLNELVVHYGGKIEENGNKFSLEDRDETSDEAFGFVDMLFKNIGNILINARDELYINEYILMRFQSHDFKASDRYTYANNQVEYIIYGLNSGGANYAAAISEIFAVRFAINLAAGFLQPKGKLFGPLMWAYALGYAFERTAIDMIDITNGKSVELFPGKKGDYITMDYKDHLRLFLFVHMEGEKFERLMAVLHHDTDQDLSERSTYVTAKATSTVNLWFLPQVIDMLGSTKAINGRVEGNTFYIEKEVHASY